MLTIFTFGWLISYYLNNKSNLFAPPKEWVIALVVAIALDLVILSQVV